MSNSFVIIVIYVLNSFIDGMTLYMIFILFTFKIIVITV